MNPLHHSPTYLSTIDMKKASHILLSPVALPEGLAEKVTMRIRSEVRKAARRIAVVMGAGTIIAFAALANLIRLLAIEVSASSLGQYFSIIFSDTGAALSIWKEISYSIVDSIPAAAIGFSLVALFALLFLMRRFAESVAEYSGRLTAA